MTKNELECDEEVSNEAEVAVGEIPEKEQPNAADRVEESSVQPPGIVWPRMPGHLHMEYLTMKDMVRFDTAMSSKADREELL